MPASRIPHNLNKFREQTIIKINHQIKYNRSRSRIRLQTTIHTIISRVSLNKYLNSFRNKDNPCPHSMLGWLLRKCWQWIKVRYSIKVNIIKVKGKIINLNTSLSMIKPSKLITKTNNSRIIKINKLYLNSSSKLDSLIFPYLNINRVIRSK